MTATQSGRITPIRTPKHTLWKRIQAARTSIVGRLLISHTFVGGFTAIFLILLTVFLLAISATSLVPSDYATYAQTAAIKWLIPNGAQSATSNEPFELSYRPPGYTIVVDGQNRVVFTELESPCAVGQSLTTCAPELVNRSAGKSFIDINGERWIEVILPLASGHRAIARYENIRTEMLSAWLISVFPQILSLVLQLSLIISLASFPASALLVWLFARPLLRRIVHIARVSQQFADGDLSVRVRDKRKDELSNLAQQFDTMADTLQQNIFVLRDLLKTNATLTAQVESAAIQTERLRFARELHDDLAQRLFSLTVSSAAVPDLIEKDTVEGIAQAKQVALLAEQTLIGLRSLLVDLRPGGLLEHGLAGGLKTLCEDWEQSYRTKIDLTIMIRSEQFAAPLQTALYQITQESLNNIAKHAKANLVVIALVEGRQQITLSISDNGRGFPLDAGPQDGHFGLLTMRERAESLGGTFTIESDSGQGTTIRAVMPLQAL